MRRYFTLAVPFLFAACASSPLHSRSSQRGAAEIEYDDHGRPIGCSWYCGAPPITVTASSTLADGLNSYDTAYIHDLQKMTAWAEGGSGSGVGTTITFTFDCTKKGYADRKDNPLGIDSFSLINGFARTPQLWQANGRVKTFKVTFNGVAKGTVEVADTIEPQKVKLPDLTLQPGKKNRLVLEIADVYRGTTHDDTCIADIRFDGYGVH